MSANLSEELAKIPDFRTTDGRRHQLWVVLLIVIMGKTRNRITIRTVSVFDDLSNLSPDWVGLKALIKVERRGWRGGQPYHQLAYYISNLMTTANIFAHGIRAHWTIENRLHSTKDVVLEEDDCSIYNGFARANFSIPRSIAINVLRRNGFSSTTRARRLIGNNLSHILALFQSVRE